MALVAELARPSLGCRHHRIVNADWKEDGRLPLPLLSKRLANFILNPITGNRPLREYQQELVPHPDRCVDRIPDLRADGHIVRREPASYTFVLQVGMKPIGEHLVFGRVADETRIVLDCITAAKRASIQ